MKRKLAISVLILAILISLYFILFPHKRRFNLQPPFSVTLTDGGKFFPVFTSAQTVSDFLGEQKISIAEKDYIFPALDAKIFPGENIFIRRAIPVKIAADGGKIEVDTLGTTVRDAVNEASITLSHADKISPELDSLLQPDLDIVVTRINFEEISVEEDILFETVEKEDSAVMWRKRETKQKGENGTREKTYKITYTNGKETSRTLLGSKITKQPTSQIEVVGTKIVVGKTQTGDATWYVNGSDMTCASLDFPFGTYLRVTNKSNGKSVIVQVNDSGPYGKGRVIDLNKKAFQKIAGIGAGVVKVKVEEILN
ncbi:MAG: ubiquitin-like domain-containing protein [Candidatus Moranbacteria bacterium]|nr:ubiquitin-like domain-containing protein [Candidatus Moranbacteria bacterium]